MNIIDLSEVPECLEPLAQWHQAEWTHLNPGKTLEMRIEEMQEYLEGKPVPRTFVYMEGDLLKGSAAIIENDMDSKPELTPWLASVYVDQPFRKQGIGSCLVKHVMKYAKDVGINTLYLYTEHKTSFYEKMGWVAVSTEEYRQQEVTVMKAVLLQNP